MEENIMAFKKLSAFLL